MHFNSTVFFFLALILVIFKRSAKCLLAKTCLFSKYAGLVRVCLSPVSMQVDLVRSLRRKGGVSVGSTCNCPRSWGELQSVQRVRSLLKQGCARPAPCLGWRKEKCSLRTSSAHSVVVQEVDSWENPVAFLFCRKPFKRIVPHHLWHHEWINGKEIFSKGPGWRYVQKLLV